MHTFCFGLISTQDSVTSLHLLQHLSVLITTFLPQNLSTSDASKKYFEPPHNKTNKITRASSEYSDPPRHLPSLIRVFSVHLKNVSGSLVTQKVCSEDSDQTGRMLRLIRVFAGRTCSDACKNIQRFFSAHYCNRCENFWLCFNKSKVLLIFVTKEKRKSLAVA